MLEDWDDYMMKNYKKIRDRCRKVRLKNMREIVMLEGQIDTINENSYQQTLFYIQFIFNINYHILIKKPKQNEENLNKNFFFT